MRKARGSSTGYQKGVILQEIVAPVVLVMIHLKIVVTVKMMIKNLLVMKRSHPRRTNLTSKSFNPHFRTPLNAFQKKSQSSLLFLQPSDITNQFKCFLLSAAATFFTFFIKICGTLQTPWTRL